MPARTDLLVIGAGPYAYATAAYAGSRGIDTHVVGSPMAAWREQMPTDMYLRSGPDWHLDATGEHTFAAFFEDRGLDPADHDPIPIGVFLDHTDWFAEHKGLAPDQRLVTRLEKPDGRFVATMADGTTIEADRVVAAPGIGYFAQRPDWHDRVPAERCSHTSELVAFDSLAGAQVAVIGGRQSAYEWAALLCDHRAAR
ncbi:MAG TPA: NAD(P)-binding domain-containing protein, partial [Nocardioides sp.]|nr:NAD(P)-binding domain-containing protein [Nocardioides sp.]